MKSLDEVVLDPEFVGGTISHEQLEECNHKGQHLIEDCGLDLSSVVGEPGPMWERKACANCEAPAGEACSRYCTAEDKNCDCPTHTAGECPGCYKDYECETHRNEPRFMGHDEAQQRIRELQDTQTKSTNPKDILAREEQRVLLHLIPSPGLVHTALAMMDGARKYGPYNWREEGVGAGTYISAAQRHLRDWLDGEECAPDSGTHHLGHAAACLMILMDAQAVGNLVDDRPAPAPTAEMMEEVKRSGKAEDAHWLNLPDYEPDYSCLEDQEDEGREEYGPGGCAV